AALSVLHQLQELRVSVPGDVLLASYVDSPVLATCNPPVTGVDIDPRLTGTLAVEILVHALEGTGPAPSGTVPAVLRVRASTDVRARADGGARRARVAPGGSDPQPAERTSGSP
ncbi:MAG: substrate-binding domain-containing protein, partial [Nocardioidaceae bacterium]